MSGLIQCPACAKQFKGAAKFAGKTFKRPSCGGAISVPATTATQHTPILPQQQAVAQNPTAQAPVQAPLQAPPQAQTQQFGGQMPLQQPLSQAPQLPPASGHQQTNALDPLGMPTAGGLGPAQQQMMPPAQTSWQQPQAIHQQKCPAEVGTCLK